MKNNLINVKSKVDQFSVIEVYPYLHYDEKFNDLDIERDFQESLDENRCFYNIHVWSKEAQDEVYNYLKGHGFETIEKEEGQTKGMYECVIKECNNPESRIYHSVTETVESLVISPSNLSISVEFDTCDLTKFKKVLKALESKYYKNKWIEENNIVIK